MTEAEALQFAFSALGGCACAIGWWIGSSLNTLSEKMERVLVQMESHQSRLVKLEEHSKVT